MRHFILSMLVAVSTGCNAAAQTCLQPEEQQAFNVVALKSTLMVGALSCGQQRQYNRFMARFQPRVLAGQHAMDHYFGHAYGLYAQIEEDSYVTDLANNESAASLSMGVDFCTASAGLFDSILALKSAADLQHFTDANPPAQPIAFTACPAALPSRPDVTVADAAAASTLVINHPPPEPRHRHVRLARAEHPAAKPQAAPEETLASVSI